MLRWAQSGRDLKAFEVKLQEVAELLENAESNLSGLSKSWAGLILSATLHQCEFIVGNQLCGGISNAGNLLSTNQRFWVRQIPERHLPWGAR